MADYYSLLARAVANLPKTSPPSARRAIYERARKALTNQLRSLKPQLPESDIAREERALDDAVARLETEFEPAVADVYPLEPAAGEAAAASPPPPPPPRPRFEPARETSASALRPPAPSARPAAPAASPPRAPAARAPAAAAATAAKAVMAPAAAATAGLPQATPFKGPLIGAAEPDAAFEAEPALGAAVRAEAAPAGAAPPLGGSLGRAEREPARPVLSDVAPRKSSTWLWVGAAVAVGFAAAIAVAALLMRPALQDLTSPAPTESPNVETSGAPEKTISRIGEPTPSQSPTAAASASPSPSAEAPAPTPTAATPVATGPSAPKTVEAPPSDEPTVAATPVATPSATASGEATPGATVPIASRAAMLVATVADAAKPAISVGTAVWSMAPSTSGQPSGVGVKAEIDIPDLKMHASMEMRKNFDPKLPASHIIDLRVTFDPGSPIKGVKEIAIPMMRGDDPPAANALAAVRAKISDSYFLIALNNDPPDVVNVNLKEIADRGWFDFPMQLDDDRIAKLTFEKGADGDRLIAKALAAWK